MRRLLWFTLLLVALLLGGTAAAQEDETTFVPIGGYYGDTFPGFLEAALPVAESFDSGRFYILMLPMTFSYDPETLTAEDLLINTYDAERRRRQLEQACAEVTTELECEVALAPVYTREAADLEALLDYFPEDLAAVYFLGGDQVIAMQITAGTRLEAALTEAYGRGVVMGGNSAGLAIQSRAMIGGYGSDEFGPENALNEGAVDLWNDEAGERRGLVFGVGSAVLEQHFWERARLPRLLNALAQPGVRPIGVGVDGYTGAIIRNQDTVSDVFGLYGVGVFDAETLGAAENAEFVDGILSMHNVLVHTLAPGGSSYNLTDAQPSEAESLTSVERNFDLLRTPPDAGALYLTGSVAGVLADDATVARFLETSGGEGASFLVVVPDAQYAADTTEAIQEEFFALGDAQGVRMVTTSVISPIGPPADVGEPTDYDGIILVGDDAATYQPELLAWVVEAWLSGIPLLAEDAGAAIVGAAYAQMPPTPYDSEDDLAIEAATQGTLLEGGTPIASGLGLLPIVIETRIMEDNRYGRLFSLAYQNPDLLAIGLPDGAGLEITADGATVLGSNGVFVLDLRAAELGVGDNGALLITNGLLDVFAPGETVVPVNVE